MGLVRDRNDDNTDGLLQDIMFDSKCERRLQIAQIQQDDRRARGQFKKPNTLTLTRCFATVMIDSSISNGEMTSPPLLMISLERPVM